MGDTVHGQWRSNVEGGAGNCRTAAMVGRRHLVTVVLRWVVVRGVTDRRNQVVSSSEGILLRESRWHGLAVMSLALASAQCSEVFCGSRLKVSWIVISSAVDMQELF